MILKQGILSVDALKEMLYEAESDRVERKPSTSQTGSIQEAVCAFANDLANHRQPGIVFVGVENNGSCSHFEITDKKVLRLVQNIHDDGRIVPLPVMSVEQHEIDGCPVIAIVVSPAENPPVYCKGEVRVRVGPSNRRATPEEERALILRRKVKTYDMTPVPGATIDTLDTLYLQQEYLPTAFSDQVLADNHRSLEHQLQALRIVDINNIPTVIGILLAGSDPLQYLPGAYIQFLRIDGEDITDPVIDEARISGLLREMIDQVLSKIRSHNRVRGEMLETGQRIQVSDYPFEALRELVANAILHRDYETTNAPIRITWFNNRIEIYSPGGPYGLVTEENFGEPGVTDYRNPTLAEAMRVLGYVERFGRGIPLTRNLLERNENPKPLFETKVMGHGNYVRVEVRKR